MPHQPNIRLITHTNSKQLDAHLERMISAAKTAYSYGAGHISSIKNDPAQIRPVLVAYNQGTMFQNYLPAFITYHP